MSFMSIQIRRLAPIFGIVFLSAGFLACPVSHAASTPEVAGKVNKLIDAAGIAHSVRQIQPGIVSAFDEPQEGLPENVRRALREAASEAFRPDPIIEKVRARLGTALTVRHLDDALVWLESPIGRRITDLENATAEPAASARIEAYARELEKRPPTKSRSELVAKLMVATGSSEFGAVMVESMVLASALGINAAHPVQQQEPIERLRQRVKATIPPLRKQSDEILTLSMLYTYRSLSDQDLNSYLKFLNSASGSAYTKGALAGLREGMLEAMARYTQAIPKAVVKEGRSVET